MAEARSSPSSTRLPNQVSFSPLEEDALRQLPQSSTLEKVSFLVGADSSDGVQSPDSDLSRPASSTTPKDEENGSNELGIEDVISLDSQDTISDDSSNCDRGNHTYTKHHKSLMR